MGHPSNELRRLKTLQSNIPVWRVDAVIVTGIPNIRYLTGFTGSSSVLVVTPSSAYFLTDSRYIEQAYDEVIGFRIKGYKRQIHGVSLLLKKLKAKRIGFEAKEITCDYYRKLKEAVSGHIFVSLSDKINTLRTKKDESEISLIKQAVRLGTAGFDIAKMCIKDGANERDAAFKMEFGMRKEGAERLAFDIIVASGKRAALPHGKASIKKIKKGEMVIVDSGVVYNGYNSDETCTFFVGKPSRQQKEIYNIVKEAHDRAIDAVGQGVMASFIDSTARGIIKKAGYGKYFGHGTGHGVGLSVHEFPSISCLDKTVLEENMVFTIEPGIYIPDFGGVRIEDMVVVTRDGCDVLTRVSKEMTVL